MILSDLHNALYTINYRAVYKQQFWIGTTYQIKGAGFGFMAGVDLCKKYRIGYSYEGDNTQLNNFPNRKWQNNEVVLAVMF